MTQKLYLPFLLLLLTACTAKHPSLPASFTQMTSYPDIFPDYRDVTVPYNIAPLNFLVDSVDDVVAHIAYPGGEQTFGGEKNKVQMEVEEWHTILNKSRGKSLSLTIYTEKESKWQDYTPYSIHVAHDEIDP